MNYNLSPAEIAAMSGGNRLIGMTRQEIAGYSLSRLIRGLMAAKESLPSGLEFDASRETYQHFDQDPPSVNERRVAVPPDYLERDLHVATPGAGGYLTQTSNVGFIEIRRKRSVAFSMGAIGITDLRDDVTIPRQTAAASVQWLANETVAPTESQQSFGQLPLSPRIISAYVEVSRQLLNQSSPAADGIIERDLAVAVAIAIDSAAINGSGSLGEPEGILQTTGINTASGTGLDYAATLECQSDVLTDNAMIDLNTTGYVTTTAVASLLMQRVKFTGTASQLWEGTMAEGSLAGHFAMSSEQVPAASMIFGDWSQLVIAEWGALELEVNPYANFKAGTVGIRAILSVDIALRHPQSFCAVTSID